MIRPIRPHEWPEAMSVIRAALGGRYDRWLVPETVEACSKSTLVYAHRRRIVGVACFFASKYRIEIPLIAVHPSYQRRGIASELVQFTIERRHQQYGHLTADIPIGASWSGVSFFRALGWDYRFDERWMTQHFSIRPAPVKVERGFLWKMIARFA